MLIRCAAGRLYEASSFRKRGTRQRRGENSLFGRLFQLDKLSPGSGISYVQLCGPVVSGENICYRVHVYCTFFGCEPVPTSMPGIMPLKFFDVIDNVATNSESCSYTIKPSRAVIYGGNWEIGRAKIC